MLGSGGQVAQAWSTSDRAVQAARASGDPLIVAEATRLAATVLRRTRRHDSAQRLVLHAARQLDADTGLTDRRQAALYGQLLAVAAYTAAMRDDRDTAWGPLGEADTPAGGPLPAVGAGPYPRTLVR